MSVSYTDNIYTNGNLSVSGTTTLGTTNISNNLTVNGSIIPKQTGQLINTKFYTIPAVSGSSALIITSSSTVASTPNTLIYYIDYTPINESSTIELFVNTVYTVSGTNGDSFQSFLYLLNGTSITGSSLSYGYQLWTGSSGGGTRSNTLLPLTGIYQNSNTTVKRFGLTMTRSSGDDTLTTYTNNNCALFTVKEYTR